MGGCRSRRQPCRRGVSLRDLCRGASRGRRGRRGRHPDRDPRSGPRAADVEARRFVGARGSSVFPTPIRPVLEAPTYADARAVAVELTGKSVSAQSYALRHKILEVDEHSVRDARLIEVHPEVSFSELARRPLLSKHRSDGLAERRALLEEAGIDVPEAVPGSPSLTCSMPQSPPGARGATPKARQRRFPKGTRTGSGRSGAEIRPPGATRRRVRAPSAKTRVGGTSER